MSPLQRVDWKASARANLESALERFLESNNSKIFCILRIQRS
jgi:hypothetical protein